MVFYIAYRSTVYELRTTFPCPCVPRDLKHIDRALNESSHFINESSLKSSTGSRYYNFRRGLYHLLLLISYLKTDSFSIVVVPREAVVRYSICDTDRLFTMAVFTLETDYPFLDG